MDVKNINSTNPVQKSFFDKKSDDLGDQFIRMLTEQLKNQDPTDPLDANDMVAQMAQISTVEQLSNNNSLTNDLIAAVDGIKEINFLSLSGKEVTTVVNEFEVGDSNISVDSKFIEDVPEGSKVIVSIVDENGNSVRDIEIDKYSKGDGWQWDGTDNEGNSVTEGKYYISSHYEDDNGEFKNITSSMKSSVSSVNLWPSQSISLDNGLTIKMGGITSVA